MRFFLFISLFSMAGFGEFLETDSIMGNNDKIKIIDTLLLKITPPSSSPDSILCRETGSAQVKATVYPDSVRAARQADSCAIADTALHTSHYERIVFVAKSGGDFSTIQAAINSISDAATNKRYMVYVFPGLYTEQVTMKSWVDLIGADRHGTRIQFSGNNNGTIILASSVLIQNLLIEQTNTATEWGIVGANTHNIHIRNVDILGPQGGSTLSQGIKITGDSLQTILIEHVICNYFGTTGNAFYFSGKTSAPQNSDMTLNDVFIDAFYATTGGGMYYKDLYACRVRSSLFRTSANGYDIKIDDASAGISDILVEGTTLEFGNCALEVDAGAAVKIKHSVVENYSSCNNGTVTFYGIADSAVHIPNHEHRRLIDSTTGNEIVKIDGYKVFIKGNRPSLLENLKSAGRSTLIIRADSTNAYGFGMNLFGNTDNTFPGGIKLYVNGKCCLAMDSTGKIDSIYSFYYKFIPSIVMTDSVCIARGDGLIGRISASSFRTGIGAEPTITAGTTSQYWRGDKSWQTLNVSAVANLVDSLAAKLPLHGKADSSQTTNGLLGVAVPDLSTGPGYLFNDGDFTFYWKYLEIPEIYGLPDSLALRLHLHGKADSSKLADSTKKDAPHGVTANYVPFSEGTNVWDESALRYNESYNNLSIGTAPVSNIKFYSSYTPTNLTRYNGYFLTQPSVTEVGTYGGYALNAYCYTNLSGAGADAGSYMGFYMRALHLTAGNVAALYGLRFRYGTYGAVVANVTSAVAGMALEPYTQGTGTIAKWYDMVISAPVGGTATVTADSGIVSDHDAPSRLAGSLTITDRGTFDTLQIGSSGSKFKQIIQFDGDNATTHDSLFISVGAKTWKYVPVADQ